MPRPAIPAALKCLRTYDAKTTQTTDEQLWSHFTEEFVQFEKTAYKNTALLDRAVAEFYGTKNPYSECSWRYKSPDRIYQTPFEWLCQSDADFELVDYHFYMLKLLGDLKVCLKHLDWEKNTDYCEKVSEMLELGEKYQNDIKAGTDELKVMEERKYELAKRAWHKANPSVMQMREMKARHEYHGEKRKESIKSDPDAKKFYENEPDPADWCLLCIKERENSELCKEDSERLKAEIAEMKAAAALASSETTPEPFETELGDYDCEACKFHTQYRPVYAMHLRSPDHLAVQKQKSLFCDRCNVQCRTLIELNQHLTTKKHKNAENPDAITPQVFSCKACAYETQFKGNFENHLKSKKHSEKAAKA
jgi:hypothetical protein